jgi:RES domain
MNPPGIPMMYVSETFDTAVAEVRNSRVSVGQFEVTKEIKLLDLFNLPDVPGIFSNTDRRVRLGLSFLWGFSRAISAPVERSDRTHVDYIPSQVVTEFIRDSKLDGENVQGIIYRSAVDNGGSNVVLFATQNDLSEADGEPVCKYEWRKPDPWLQLRKTWADVRSKPKAERKRIRQGLLD